ncbi:MAG TPA: DUF2157 domain-containing protein, partial [bacterium]|nr:DUF2157 domain-containing protein [bacterium]
MSRRNVEWLYGQLPDLVENQIVPEDVAEKIRTYYEPQSQQKPRSVALIICGVLGSLLIGLGIILLLAHNWNQLSRPVRTVICFAPLLLGQALAAWTLLKQRGSIAWQESSSTFLMAAIGASIALIGQTYNIPGDMESFILVWMLLTIPIVYLLGASVPAVFYLIGSVCWAGYARWGAGHAMFYWLLLVPVLPHIYLAYRRSPGGFRSLSLFWVFTITLIIGTGMALEYYGSQQWILAYLSLFSSLYLLSDRVFSRSLFALKNPLFLGGTIGVAVVSLILTYRFPWSHLFATYSYFE